MSGDGRAVAQLPVVRAAGAPLVITEEIMAEGLKRAADGARKAERAAQVKARDAALDAQAAAHASELKRVAAETIEAQKVAHAHGWHKAAWMFGFGGAAAGSALTLIVMMVAIGGGSESAMRGAGVGAAIRAQDNYDQRADEVLGGYAPCGQPGEGPNCPRVREPVREPRP